MKKVILLATVCVLIMALLPAVAFAGTPQPPNRGVVDPRNLWPGYWSDVDKIISSPKAPGGQIRVVEDPLNSVITGQPMGWVTFSCQSTVGFHYNIGETGLTPGSNYDVHAVGAVFEIVAPGTPGSIDTGEGFWILPVGGVDWDLGTFRTDAHGLGGVKGVLPLSQGVYAVTTTVSDSQGNVILTTPADDPDEFVVF